MPHSPWPDLPRLQLPQIFGRRSPQGLVLGGGGARASFQIGALRYLYARVDDFCPQVIAGSSAGAILGAFLAQHADRAGQAEVLDRLETIWFSLREQNDMFSERRWFRQFQEHSPELAALVAQARPAERPAPRPDRWREMRVFQLFGRFGNDEPEPVEEPPAIVEQPDPFANPLLGFVDEPDYTGPEVSWSPSVVLQVVNALPLLGRATGDLPTMVRGAERSQSLYRPGPILRQLLAPETFSPARTQASGVQLRLATVSLETGQLRYIREDGRIVGRDDVALDVEPQDLVLGILASCSIPGVFAPVPLGDEHYVDGGVRENLPVEAAVGNLGCRAPWVLVSTPSGVATDRRPGGGPLWDVVTRSVSIVTDECLRDEVAFARAAGARVIEPELDVHEAMTVDPGLIRINHAYGWLRAREVHERVSEAVERRHREIIELRSQAWSLENQLYPGPDRTPTTEPAKTQRRLADVKQELRRAVAAMDPEDLPTGAGGWWHDWEQHATPIDAPPPWLG